MINHQPATQRLTRSRTDRKVGGVAAGMAEFMNIDPAWVRIAWLALLVLGPGVILYLVAWIVLPEADASSSAQLAGEPQRGESGQLIIGGLLVAIGGALLADRFLPWMKELILPAILIAVRTGVVIYSLRK